MGEESEEGWTKHSMMVEYVWSPILTYCGLIVKSIIHKQRLLSLQRLSSLSTNLWGIIVLKAELKLTNSILKYVFGCSRWDRAV